MIYELKRESFLLEKKELGWSIKSIKKILIILDENKAMYYNYDLDEDEFFNPKDTSAWFFFEIFKNPKIFLKSEI